MYFSGKKNKLEIAEERRVEQGLVRGGVRSKFFALKTVSLR
jgi:hypothetical protein